MRFRWNEWNREHIGKHGVTVKEAESVVRQARRPYPTQIGNNKLLVIGRGNSGRLLQVIFVLDPEDMVFIIHARALDR